MSKIHLIGNAHLDPVWLWRWQEGYSEVLATYKSALDRMNDFDDFKFTAACAAYYEWIEETAPEVFEEIKKRVAEDRWNIVGGWYIQPDCNMPDGESFARQALVSQRYFKEKFGVIATTGYNVDSFGHNAGLPKILKASGMDNYVFMRPMPHEQGRDESLFMWESDDENRVCAFRIPLMYNFDLKCMEKFAELKEKADKENMDYMAFYGVGNHGGGPTIALIDAINNLNIDGAVYSTPDEYFADVDKEKLPVITGDLQHHARGCYSAESSVKAKNRKCEQNLLAAEKLSIMAKELTGAKYPKEELERAWKNLLFNQFHDILCGCAIKESYKDADYLYGEIMAITEKIINSSVQKIAWNIDTLKGEHLPCYKSNDHWRLWEHEVLGTPVVVFNPHPWNVKTVVKIDCEVKKVTDCENNEIQFQTVRGYHANTPVPFPRAHTVFVAEVPAMGYATYRMFTEKESTLEDNSLIITERMLENNKIKVEFDDKTGDICKFYNKETGEYIIDNPCRAIILDETGCDTWAHDKEKFGEIVGQFEKPQFKVLENGPIRAILSVTTEYNNSTLERKYIITKDSNEINVEAKIDFCEKFRTLKFAFPACNDVIAKIPYGTIKKFGETGEEPCGSWIASGKLCVANDSKYAYDNENGEMRLTVLRTAIYADHGGRDEFSEHMDMGVTEFVYSVFPYTNNAESERKAAELNFSLPYVLTTFHNGKLSEKNCGFDCDCDDLIVTAIKQSEDTEENIVRMYEANGNDVSARLMLFGKEISVALSHNSIKTVNENKKELNLMEW